MNKVDASNLLGISPGASETEVAEHVSLPVQREALAVERADPPIQQQTTPVKREASSVDREVSPVEGQQPSVEPVSGSVEAVKSPMARFSSPVERVAAPMARVSAPIERVGSPIKRVSVPIERVGSPMARVSALIERVAGPMACVSALIERVAAPMARVSGSMERIGSPIERVSAPIESEATSPKSTETSDQSVVARVRNIYSQKRWQMIAGTILILALIAALDFFRSSSTERSKSGTLILNTIPDNADIYLEDAFQGKTPLVLEHVAPGDHRLKIELPGYVEEDFIVPVKPGSEAFNRIIELVPLEPSYGQPGATQNLKPPR